jgi:hypothetical protein
MNSAESSINTELKLSESDRKLLERFRGEERSRFHALPYFIVAALFLWLYWDAPFAYSRFEDIPSDQRKDLPYAAIRSLPMWCLGIFWLWRAIYSTFLDRKRRLLVRLAANVLPEAKRNA